MEHEGPARRGEGSELAGESPDFYTVVVDSAVGVGARPSDHFDEDMQRLREFMENLPAPKWPYLEGEHAIDQDLAIQGKPIYERLCAECHDPGRERCNRVIPTAEIGTDPEREKTWTQQAADKMNVAINEEIGAKRPDVIKSNGVPRLAARWHLGASALPPQRRCSKSPGASGYARVASNDLLPRIRYVRSC